MMTYEEMRQTGALDALGASLSGPVTESEQVKYLRDLLTETERELHALRARVAERDASVAWAIRRGR